MIFLSRETSIDLNWANISYITPLIIYELKLFPKCCNPYYQHIKHRMCLAYYFQLLPSCVETWQHCVENLYWEALNLKGRLAPGIPYFPCKHILDGTDKIITKTSSSSLFNNIGVRNFHAFPEENVTGHHYQFLFSPKRILFYLI